MEYCNMGTQVSRGLQFPTLMNSERFGRKSSSSVQFLQMNGDKPLYHARTSRHMLAKRERFHLPIILKVSCSSEISPARVLDSKNKVEEIKSYLNGQCVYLVGMMGSGKTTVGKVLAESLAYSFCDCDELIEEAIGGGSVANIFKLHGENFFRDNETEVLHKLSLMQQLIVSTGGGGVVRPINWRHMRKGISVWLDVPLEELAQRIAADGTGSRPLIPKEPGDIVKRLSAIFDERGEAYANADVTVPLENIAAKLGVAGVCKLTPSAIANEVLLQIENFLKK